MALPMHEYVGVFCVNCNNFMQQSSPVEVDHRGVVARHFDITSAPTLTCLHCEATCTYSQNEVAHSNSSKGADARYPYRLPQSRGSSFCLFAP
jgi:hypothetical protein